MGQQPNIELHESDLPRKTPEPAPARRWRPTKPGLIVAPDGKPGGGMFGSTGPDHGWAWRLLNEYELPDDDPDLRSVVAGLTMARAAAMGRAAIREDIDVALTLCGYGDNLPAYLDERRVRWLDAAPHDKRPGQTAVMEVDPDLLAMKHEQLKYVLNRTRDGEITTTAHTDDR